MAKRINTLNTASSPANDDYLPIDGATNGTRKISADFVNNLITDVEVDGTSVVTSGVAEIDLSGKQDTLTAGSNITIAQDGTISATDTTYTAGTNVDITGGVISATDTTYTAGTNVTIDANNVISASDTTYTAGTNVQINNGVISATDTTYSAFGGATAGADGSSGLVPQPLIADKNKFLKGDGTWDTIQPGASALDDLTNVDITSPTNGQVLKYDSTNQEWVNANESGGGGGASAVADLTDVNLTSLANGQILKYDSTSQKWINSDESGGGTSGTMDILWEGSAAPTTANPITVSLNGNISDYDMIMVNGYEGTNNCKCTGTFAKLAVGDNGLLLATSDNQLYINIEVATDSSIIFKGYSSSWGAATTYTGIYGVKTGGGGGSGGVLKGLDYANAVTLTLPDHTGYDYTPTGYGVLMATSYGGAGCITIADQNEDAKYLTFRDDTWTTPWVPVTKNETYHVSRGSSSTDFPSGSWFKFIPWLCEGGSGGGAAAEMTLPDYNALTTAQKNDGTIRFIPQNPYGIITDVDMSTITNLSENKITVTPSADEIEMDFDHSASNSIGGTFYILTPVDVTNYDYLKYDLTTGVCYNSLHSDTNPGRNLGIGLCRNAPSSWQICPNVSWEVSNIYDVNDINSTFTDEIIDVSALTGVYYFVVAFVAWEATISNLKLATAGGYPSQIKYMDKTYGISSASEVTYSTTEHKVGTWIDGSTVYEKTWDFGSGIVISANNTWTNTSIVTADYDMDLLLSVTGLYGSGTVWGILSARCDTTYVQLQHPRGDALTIQYLTLRYTKVSS